MILTLEPASWAILLLTGCALGIGFGLFGRLGGLALTPALLIALPYCGVSGDESAKIASATAIALLVPLSVSQTEGRLARRAIDWDLLALMAPGAAIGSMLIIALAEGYDDRVWVGTQQWASRL